MTEERLALTRDRSLPLAEVVFTFVRSGGPGGQNVNKVSSKAVLRWNMKASSCVPEEVKTRFASLFPFCVTKEGEVVLTCQKSRDAPKNRVFCLENLQAKLVAALTEPKKRIPTRPTRNSIRRRLEAKAHHAEKKQRRREIRVE